MTTQDFHGGKMKREEHNGRGGGSSSSHAQGDDSFFFKTGFLLRQLMSKVDSLSSEISSMRDRIEDVSIDLTEKTEELKSQMGAVSAQLDRLERERQQTTSHHRNYHMEEQEQFEFYGDNINSALSSRGHSTVADIDDRENDDNDQAMNTENEEQEIDADDDGGEDTGLDSDSDLDSDTEEEEDIEEIMDQEGSGGE